MTPDEVLTHLKRIHVRSDVVAEVRLRFDALDRLRTAMKTHAIDKWGLGDVDDVNDAALYAAMEAGLPKLSEMKGIRKGCLPPGVDSVAFVRALRDGKEEIE